jgi:hypothetical protein
VDYVPVNLEQRYYLPKRAKQKDDIASPTVYDGRDEMHFSPAE